MCVSTEVELAMSPGCSGESDCRAGLGEAAVYDQTAGRRRLPAVLSAVVILFAGGDDFFDVQH
ncbi:hypothetical protein ACWC4J_20060, partial [Streptomyces sp. NPDC001356]